VYTQLAIVILQSVVNLIGSPTILTLQVSGIGNNSVCTSPPLQSCSARGGCGMPCSQPV